jgi:light-regulated signal transduction histidine kinase (bacteriophytochrome)
VELKDALRGLDGGADDFLLEPVEPAYLVAKVRSLMRLRTVEEELRQSNQNLAQFAFVASHDLQEPLRTMTVFAQLLKRDYQDSLDFKAHEYINRIVTSGQRMANLIHDLLEYSRVSSGKDRELVAVDLNSVIAQIREWIREPIEEAQGELIVSQLPTVLGVEVRIAQVFRNLVENSIRYRRRGVPLRVKIDAVLLNPEQWQFTVADNGSGFEMAYSEEIFRIFRRLDPQESEGTGIGLAICRTVVEAAGGRIWAEGCPGEGATFFFTWPAQASALP